MEAGQSVTAEYGARLARWKQSHERLERRFRQIGNARLATGVSAVAVAAVSFGAGWISAWWLLAPLAVFVALAIAHDPVDTSLEAASRAVSYYERALARVGNRWMGGGSQGERFRDPKHLYADDLDLFGRGSLFELLSTSRTAAGERILAGWLLAPGQREDVLARQGSVAELRPRIDLREQIALMGEEIRSAVDDRGLKEWGERPGVAFFRGARLVAAALAAAAVVTLVLFFAQAVSLRPFLTVILAEVVFGFSVRDSVRKVLAGASTPAHELELLGLLLQRLEREEFQSPALLALRAAIQVEGRLASLRIDRLRRLVHHLYSARNQFFAVIAAPLLWTAQFAMAVEAWREHYGPHIGQWMAAVGEFEALCSLASFAYERDHAVFPDLAEGSEPRFEARALVHPLLPQEEAVANDAALGGPLRLWIVSGSNMSGKSTLLRSVGLNTVLAWAGAPVTAEHLSVSRLRIGASMRTSDSVLDHRSRFYAEISRLRDVMELARAGNPTLFLLDELLSGTNSHDRRIGAEALIRGLVERGALGMVTTHDLALAEIAGSLDGRAVNVHFEDHLEGGEMRFDFRLRPGVVTRSNALALMRAVGLEV
jgi:MutS-like protein